MPPISTTVPCDCCGEIPTSCLECRVRDGSITICGFGGFGDSEKRFKTLTLSGEHLLQRFQDAGCSIGDGCVRKSYSGTCSYEPQCVDGAIDCNLSVGGNCQTEDAGDNNCEAWNPPTNEARCSVDLLTGWDGGITLSESETEASYAGTGTCFVLGGGGGVRAIITGTVTFTLSDEDTRDDALARLQACAEWGDWRTGCSAVETEGVWNAAQWRINKTALDPSTSYDFTVEYWRRPVGGGEDDWVLYATLDLSDTTDGSGNLVTAPEDIPNAEGYETEARCDCVFTITPP